MPATLGTDISFLTILISAGALSVAIWQARCNMRSQLISQRGLELQEQRERLAMLDTQYGQHITAHTAALEQIRIEIAVLREQMRLISLAKGGPNVGSNS